MEKSAVLRNKCMQEIFVPTEVCIKISHFITNPPQVHSFRVTRI